MTLSLIRAIKKDIWSVYLEGTGLRHDRLEGSKNSGDASGAPAIAQVHLENGRAAIHWALGLVRAYGKTGGAARDRRKFSLAAS